MRRATLDDLLDEETKPGDTIGNLKIRETYTGLDGLVDTILYGLVRPYTVIVTGTIYTRNQNADKIEETENEKK
ncbi:MAG: hypothetical protein K8S54_04860 [Spirochaetia bacterium]|nr:hypothetical protein [Spirochaetia bacterium]